MHSCDVVINLLGEFASKENLCWRCICQCTKTSCKDNNNKIDSKFGGKVEDAHSVVK